MLHEEFAERIAGRLEARAEIPENGGRPERGATTVRARELRVAAELAREVAASVSLEEAPPPEAQA
jgi:hypothetical protein